MDTAKIPASNPSDQGHAWASDDEQHARRQPAQKRSIVMAITVTVLCFCVGILFVMGFALRSKTIDHDKQFETVSESVTKAHSNALVAKAMADAAAKESSTAMQMARVVASGGDLPIPEGEIAKGVSEDEMSVHRLMAARKAKEEANRAEFLKLSQKVAAHEGALATINEDVRANARYTTDSLKNLSTAIRETASRLSTETDGKITLALSKVPTSKEVDDLRKITSDLHSENQNTDLTVSTLRERVASMSNRLANTQLKDVKIPKAQKAKGTNVVAVKAGEIDKDEEQIVSGAITRTGRPVVKKGWFRRDSVTVTYVVTLNAPNGTDIDLGEATFQAFENANGGIMSDLAKVSEKDTVRLARLSKELTNKFGDFLKEGNKLPKEVKFVGAQAKATPPASNP